GDWQPGDLIPTENELIKMYNVSRTTVREAINALVNEGKLEKRQGRGTTVCKPKIVETLGHLTGFSEEMINKGYVPGAKLLLEERIVAPDKVAEKLNRSEEHTSELQSRENLVCRLLLEKKKICISIS